MGRKIERFEILIFGFETLIKANLKFMKDVSLR
jgi:hypothetical protein